MRCYHASLRPVQGPEEVRNLLASSGIRTERCVASK